MKSFLILLVVVSLGFILRAIAPRFELWVEHGDWARVDRIMSAACGVFVITVMLFLVAAVVNAAVTEAIAQAAH